MKQELALPRLATALLLLVQLGMLALFAINVGRALAFPYALDYGEGPLLDQVLRLARFENIYQAELGRPPYTISNYPPLYHLVQLPLVWLGAPAYWYGRAIGVASLVGTALGIGLILQRLTRDRAAAWIAGLSLFALSPVFIWAIFARVDALALGLSMLALVVIVRWPARNAALVATALLLAASICTRQSYVVAAPLAAGWWLFSQGLRRRALALAGIVAALVALAFGGLSLASDGGFLRHVLMANVNAYSFKELSTILGYVWPRAALFVLLGVLYLGLARRVARGPWQLIAVYLLGGMATSLMAGKVGANMNYLFEYCAGTCLAAGGLFAACRERPRLRAALALALAAQLAYLGWLTHASILPRLAVQYSAAGRADAERVRKLVQQEPGVILTDVAMGFLPLEGRRLYLQPFEMTQLARGGTWDQSRLVADLRAGRFPLLLVNSNPLVLGDRWTREMRDAIAAAYVVAWRQRSIIESCAVEIIGYHPRP